MIHCQGHPSLSANQNRRSLFGGQRTTIGGTPGTTAMSPNSWLPRALSLYELNHIRDAATGAGNTFTLDIYDGGSSVASLTMVNGDGTQKVSTFTATLTAATSGAVSECHIVDHTQTGATSALGTSTFVYQDPSNTAASYYCAGDGTSSIGSANGRFIAIGGAGTTGSTVEASVQMPILYNCTLKYAAARYISEAATDWQIEIRKVATSGTGVSQDTLDLPANTTGGLVTDNALAVSLAVGDLLSFRMVRTAGVGTVLQINLVFGIEVA